MAKAAEEFITNCGRCGAPFVKSDVRIPTPKKSAPREFWFLCLDCFEEEGKVWWATCDVKYIVERG